MKLVIPEAPESVRNLQEWLFFILSIASVLILWRTKGRDE